MGTLQVFPQKNPGRKPINIYLLSPYSHPDPAVRQERHDRAVAAAAVLVASGYNVFSPITHSHAISKLVGNSNNSGFWTDLDLSFLDRWADHACVLMIDGWLGSDGIKSELARAMDNHIGVRWLSWEQVVEMAADMGVDLGGCGTETTSVEAVNG
jgi:hypothetical protein